MKINEKTKDIIEWIVCILIALILALFIKRPKIPQTYDGKEPGKSE